MAILIDYDIYNRHKLSFDALPDFEEIEEFRSLTRRQKMFIIYRHLFWTISRAYSTAYECEDNNANFKSAVTLMGKPFMKIAWKKTLELAMSNHVRTANKVKRMYEVIGFYDPKDIVTKDGKLKVDNTLEDLGELSYAINSIKTTKTAYGTDVSVSLADRKNALNMLSKITRLVEENQAHIKSPDVVNVNIQVKGDPEIVSETDEEKEDEIDD